MMRSLRNSLLFCSLMGLVACSNHPAPEVRAEEHTTHNTNKYTIFYPQGLSIQALTSRPKATNSAYLLSVAAAYTDLDTYQPLDLLVYQGHKRQAKVTVGFLDGVLTIKGDQLTISQIARGQTPSPAQLAEVSNQKGTLLLQDLLVYQGKNQKPAGGSLFQRRALVEFADHHFAVAESASDYLTLQQFGDDLIELGAQNALYLDMGDWDEGWYKVGNTTVKLGNRRTQTAKQSNWLVFAKPTATPAQP
jgi:hypothetical protein